MSEEQVTAAAAKALCEFSWTALLVAALGFVGLWAYIKVAKVEKGFGPYNTGTLLLVLIVALASVLVAAGRMDAEKLMGLLFAVAGFAGGVAGVVRLTPPSPATRSACRDPYR